MKKAWNQAVRRMHLVYTIGLLSLGLSGLTTAAVSDREQVFEQAREHLQGGRALQAYELLVQYEVELSGQDSYDYLLGIAALDSGASGEAIFSLQRLVARRPAFSGARMELARAYYDIGDNELARAEFERVLADSPPEKVQLAANNYMQAIDAKARVYRASTQYYIDLGFGWDDNASAATDERIFLGIFRLNDKNVEQDSAFFSTRLGLLYSKPLSAESQFILTASISHRSNPSAHYVDPSSIDLGLGWNWKRGPHSVFVGGNTIFSALDGTHDKNNLSLLGNYSYELNDTWVASAFIRAGSLRFEESQLEVRDVDQYNYGVSLTQSYTNAQFNVSLYGTVEDARESDSIFSTDGYGVSISNSWFRPGGRVYFVQASASSVDYDDDFTFLSSSFEREDDLYSIGIGASFARFPVSNWTTTINLNFSEKDSTVSLYEFDRAEFLVSLRKIF
ncbi:MAG: DUF560 domain-containing protein [Pseudomonadales bacterium]|nr:DUF560 domain-containing protein [Pseudomonadales bacterium]